MSTTLRRAWLRSLKAVGKERFIAKSSLGHRFVCHLGDSLGENPFYNRETFRAELELCAAILEGEEKPVIFDVGANVGFWSTHIAQMLKSQAPEIYAFEPAPSTFRKLLQSVELLDLEKSIHVIAAAVLDKAGPVRLSYSSWDSQWAQVSRELNVRVGDRIVFSAAITLDQFCEMCGILPTFVKIDVEGSEILALRGASNLLSRADRPCILLEYNPSTLAEARADIQEFDVLLKNYSFYYVDDFGIHKRPFGQSIDSLGIIDWVCNVLAMPNTAQTKAKYECALERARSRLNQ